MAFKRSSVKSLINTKKEFFASSYGFTKKTNFKAGSDVYVIPLGLETGFYETPCHRVITHKVDGKTIGFNGFGFPVNIKCNGIDADGNVTSSLCCDLAKMEKERFPEKDDYAKRIVGSRSVRIHLPVLVLGNSLDDDSKIAYPISKVALKKDLASEGGLKFSYLDLASGTFKKDIINAYGKKLQEDGILDYDISEESEEFIEEVLKRLTETVIKVHGGTKQGFSQAVKEYSFFPFNNPAIANGSGEGERDLIIGYKKNPKITQQISEFLALFDSEVDNLIINWKEKDLLEYYNSAIGVPLDTPLGEATPKVEETKEEEPEEVVVKKVVKEENVTTSTQEKEIEIDDTVGELPPPATDEDVATLIENPFADEPQEVAKGESIKESVEELEEFEYDSDGEDDFFAE